MSCWDIKLRTAISREAPTKDLKHRQHEAKVYKIDQEGNGVQDEDHIVHSIEDPVVPWKTLNLVVRPIGKVRIHQLPIVLKCYKMRLRRK